MQFTEQQISIVARSLSDSAALACGVNKDDTWKIYSEQYIEEATSALEKLSAAAPQVVADERAAFEKMEPGLKLERLSDESYENDFVQCAWRGWQARAAFQAAPVQAQEPVACGCKGVGGCVTSVELSAGEFCKASCFSAAEQMAFRAPVQPVAVPDGWKLVPREATRAMIDAASAVEEDGFDAMHKAMLASAPAAPAAQGDAKELTKEDMHEAYYAYSGNSEIDYDGREWSNFMGGWDAAIAAKAAS